MARSLHAHPERQDVLVEHIDGEPPQFIRACTVHHFASLPVDHVEDLDACPGCAAEIALAPGRRRFAGLHDTYVWDGLGERRRA